MPSTNSGDRAFLDAGLFIGALLRGDSRHHEARALVEQARSGLLPACTTTGILSEVYGALTWQGAQPPQPPDVAAAAVRMLIAPPSSIQVLVEDQHSAMLMLDLAGRHRLTARRVHDARHAAAAIACGVRLVYTYDVDDWSMFLPDGLQIVGPTSVLGHGQRRGL